MPAHVGSTYLCFALGVYADAPVQASVWSFPALTPTLSHAGYFGEAPKKPYAAWASLQEVLLLKGGMDSLRSGS